MRRIIGLVLLLVIVATAQAADNGVAEKQQHRQMSREFLTQRTPNTLYVIGLPEWHPKCRYIAT